MTYVPPKDFVKMRKYAVAYMPYWVFPLDFTFRSFMRIFETGLTREKRRKRVIPKKIYELDNGSSLIEFPRDLKKTKAVAPPPRKVEVPYNRETVSDWYNNTAKSYYKESYRHWLHNKWGIGTHDGRRTAIINFLILHGNNMNVQLEILARTGHESLNDLMPYVREYVTVKNMIKDDDLKIIQDLMSHIKVK